MHNPTRNILAGLLIMGTLVTSLHSQAPAPATGDPFVKDAAAHTNKDETWQNVLVVLEVYTLGQDDAAGVLESESGGAARYRRVLDLSRNGKARLENVTAITGKSGMRVVSESIDEVRYITEFGAPAFKDSLPSPKSWETRNAGETFELETVVGPDRKTCNMNLVPYTTKLKEFREIAGILGTDGKVFQPVFVSQKMTTSVWLRDNEPFYLGTLSAATPWEDAQAPATKETRLAFLRASLNSPTPEELKPAAKPEAAQSLSLEYTWFSLERAQARDLLSGTSNLNAPWEALQVLLKDKKARLEHVATLNTISGQRAVVAEADETRYATNYVSETVRPTSMDTTIHTVKTPSAVEGAPDSTSTEQSTFFHQESQGARQPGYASEFESRDIGLNVEVEPVLGPDGVSVDLNQSIHGTTNLGALQVPGVGANFAAQPLFESRKITSSHHALLGRHTLVGTFNPPGANGVNERRDTRRTWLVFVRALNEP